MMSATGNPVLSSTKSACQLLSFRSATLGALVWLVSPFVPVGTPPTLGSIEHVFLSMPLVAAPLWLLLRDADPSTRRSLARIAQRMQPLGAALLTSSFCVAKGPVAGALTGLWLAMSVLLAIDGIGQFRRNSAVSLAHTSLLAAHVFLPVGAGWLLASRLGVGPRNFAPLTVFLAALHFHFSGYSLQILIAATSRQLQAQSSRLLWLQRGVVVGAIAGIPLIAAGTIGAAPLAKFIGVAAMVCSTLALGLTTTTLALAVPVALPRYLLLASSASIAAAMLLAAIYGLGELTGAGWIDIDRMVIAHGLLNAIGFTLCGLLGHLTCCVRTRHVEAAGESARCRAPRDRG